MFKQRQLDAQIRQHLCQRVVQFAGDGGALLHQQQLVVMFLRLVGEKAAPEHGGDAFHQRYRDGALLALPAQLTEPGIQHNHRQHLRLKVLPCLALLHFPAVAGMQRQPADPGIFAHGLQDMTETVAVDFAGVHRLRAGKQHLKLLMGFVQVVSLLFDRNFQRAIQAVQLGRHMVKGAGEQAKLVWQIGIRHRGIKPALLNVLAGGDQVIERGNHLLADPAQRAERQQDNADPTGKGDGEHQLDFMFGVMLQGEYKGVDARHILIHVVLIPAVIALRELFVHALPRQLQQVIALLNLIGHVPAF
ncbi:Uncharacterised protein [Leclercia adecarboxylata]|nr:Uncharacterised protein [Leclercia adecarboxylata]